MSKKYMKPFLKRRLFCRKKPSAIKFRFSGEVKFKRTAIDAPLQKAMLDFNIKQGLRKLDEERKEKANVSE